jgi:hypothetical protein
MITAQELQLYTAFEHKLDKFFKKLDNKVKKKAIANGRMLTVVVYDEFVPDIGILTQAQQHNFHDSLHIDWIFKDPDVFYANNRMMFLNTVQYKLLHDYGYIAVNWSDFNHKNISNAMQLTFCW